MAVYFDGTGIDATALSTYISSTNVPSGNNRATICMFAVMRANHAPTSTTFFEWLTSASGFGLELSFISPGDFMYQSKSDSILNVGHVDGDLNVWHFMAMSIGGINSQTCWCARLGATPTVGINKDGLAFAGGPVRVGKAADAEGDAPLDGRMVGVKLYNHRLLGQEIIAESQSIYPVKKAGLVACWPLDFATSVIHDISGRKHDLVAQGGTLVTASGPPIARFPKKRGTLAQVLRYLAPPGQSGNATFFGTDF